ncbi:flagellar protein FlaG [Alicyclobacillus cycloheptanicus]|uniref:FlaG/YvyC family protein n=1 Tax=Alicyclobacillus cycloheptanicus TaxID=1457 RepID=A0ABT9XK49_9BACL|nr:flagellar protein FlaG [Alicyclobacillus cycloheptanicus]MDQ0190671.1 putative FlaG/YvyC family protein [Alicyclobacillus cycloheptanicus]WDM00311.1 flagellar protein FlaG [Alicyclobacillus cycloheptanicus]
MSSIIGMYVPQVPAAEAPRSAADPTRPASEANRPDAGELSNPSKTSVSPGSLSIFSRAVEQLAQKTGNASLQVEFDTQKHPGEVWLNVVDKNTGQILFEIPAQAIRQMEQGNMNSAGILVDRSL